MNSRRRRWYDSFGAKNIPQAKIQIHTRRYGESATLPEAIVRAAAAEYNRQGNDQSFEALQRRGD